MQKVKWGILGTGNIAKKFAECLKYVDNAELWGVGSRFQESADNFMTDLDIPKRYSSYQALIDDPDVQIIYVSTLNHLHYENTLACLNAGKAVLCEKPFTINAKEAKELIDLSRSKNLFLMQGLWSRYFPVYVQVREWLQKGTIGEVEMLTVSHGFRGDFNPNSRLFNPEYGGGALLDVGIYTHSLASMVLGPVKSVQAKAEIGPSGVDELLATILHHENGGISVLQSSFRTNMINQAIIMGSKGYIRIAPAYWRPRKVYLCMNGEEEQEFNMQIDSHGFQFEAQEAQDCMLAGKLESDIMSNDETLALMELLDTIRDKIGLTYPME